MMEGYQFHESMTEEERQRAVAMFFAPGEKVTVADRFAGDPKARGLLAAGDRGVLTVKSVHIGKDTASYELNEVSGLHPFRLFADVRPIAHIYGAMISVQDEPWLVELDEDDDSVRATGRCYRLSGVTGRHLSWNNGIDTMDDLIAYAAEGGCGEYAAVQEQDGGWNLVAIPWHASLSAEQREAAEEAVASCSNEPTAEIQGALH